MSLTVICGICCLGFWETVIGIGLIKETIGRLINKENSCTSKPIRDHPWIPSGVTQQFAPLQSTVARWQLFLFCNALDFGGGEAAVSGAQLSMTAGRDERGGVDFEQTCACMVPQEHHFKELPEKPRW